MFFLHSQLLFYYLFFSRPVCLRRRLQGIQLCPFLFPLFCFCYFPFSIVSVFHVSFCFLHVRFRFSFFILLFSSPFCLLYLVFFPHCVSFFPFFTFCFRSWIGFAGKEKIGKQIAPQTHSYLNSLIVINHVSRS